MPVPNRSMYQWLFPINDGEGQKKHVPLFATLLGATFSVLVELLVMHTGESLPSDLMQCAVCLTAGLALILPPTIFEYPLKTPRLKAPMVVFGLAYLTMGVLYGLQVAHTFQFLGPTPVVERLGYDTSTDVLSSLLFIVAWFLLSKTEAELGALRTERFLILVMTLALLLSGAWKFFGEYRLAEITKLPQSGDTTTTIAKAAISNARAILNFTNGAIFLGLYTQMLRILPPPDPFNRLMILLYGCAQIGAHLRDCLGATTQCSVASSEGAAAYIIGWILVIGKISFALYLFYCFYEVKVESTERGFTLESGITRH